MSLRAVFLDVGGTLLREYPSRAQIYAAAARRHGIVVPPRRMRALMYRTIGELPRSLDGHFRYSEGWFRGLIARVFGERLGLGAAAVREVEAELLARFADPATYRLHAGALELCDALKRRGLGLGVISNWSERLPAILAGLGLARRLDFVLCSAIERCEKPEPEIFERALALAAVEPNQALHAGNDLELDVRGPAALGILAVLVDHGGRPGPDRVTDLPQLERWIQDLLP